MGRTRYTHTQSPPLRRLPGSALRAVFAEGYSATDLRRDVLAGLVVGVLQIKDLLGLAPAGRADHFLERVWSYVQARHTARSSELLIGLLTLAVLALLPRWTKRVPAPLVALPLAAFLAWALHLEVATIGSRFVTVISGVEVHGIPRLPPLPVLPWHMGGDLPLQLATFRALFPAAVAIALLGAIESLLSAGVP